MRRITSATSRTVLVTFLTLILLPSASGYSVLSHEVVVDLAWTDQIEPLLLRRFPGATAEQLRQAHAFAYGGSIIQDMGYYPFGSHRFSDLAHYVRSGDFVQALLADAGDLNEYAFALGALAHYAADTEGHPAINRAVADEIPHLRQRYGPVVTYADDPKAHIRVEFGFDVAQVAKQRFPSSAYHDFIVFEVSKPLLERAFRETYGLELTEIFTSLDRAIGSYRRAVSKTIPAFTRAALATHRADLVREVPNFNEHKFVYRLSRAEYEQHWGTTYERPGTGARILAFLFHLVPKIGPFKSADFKIPTAQTSDLYFKSMNQTVDRYRGELQQLHTGELHIPNRDYDTGRITRPGEYPLTDDTYVFLLDKLAQHQFRSVSADLRDNLLEFFADPKQPMATQKSHADQWKKAVQQVEELRRQVPLENNTGGESKH